MVNIPRQFRTAFNGFNREDVVRYLEFINNRHANEVAQLRNELNYTRKNQPTMDDEQVFILEAQLADCQRENQVLKKRIAALEENLREAASSLDRRAADSPNAAELEAYRRAERVERMAKLRANQIGEQTTATLMEASTKMEGASVQIDQISAMINEQVEQLRLAVNGSHQAFQDAAQILSMLRTEIDE